MDLKNRLRRSMIGGLKPMMDDGEIEPTNPLQMAEEKLISMVEPDIRIPATYWYKKHEVQNERRRTVPDTVAANAMMWQNLRKQNVPNIITKEQIKMQDKQDQIALQLKAEFLRPKAVVFDHKGKFHRTRVDEQSWL